MDKLKQLEARIKLSEEILRFQAPHKDVILQLPTGVGKAFNFMNICRYGPVGRILFVVPQVSLVQNFKDDIEKLGFQDLLSRMDICCYASLKKYVGKEYGIIGYDECHSLASDIRMGYAKEIKALKRVLLSATLEDDVLEKLREGFEMNTFSMSYEEAVERGILPRVEIEVRSMPLDDENAIYPYTYANKNVELLTAKKHYEKTEASVKYWSNRWGNGRNGEPKKVYFNMLGAGNERLRWLAEYKTEFIKETLEGLDDERTVIFCGSVAQAHLLGGEEAVSSENSNKKNAEVIAKFNNLGSNRIYAKGMLIVGMNLASCKYAIVAAIGKKALKGTQQIGRLCRHDKGKMIVLIAEGTVDEENIKLSLKIDKYGNKI